MTDYLYPKNFSRFYDIIYHQIRDEVDSKFFLKKINQTKGKILEIGTGTGRFFSEALAQGVDIYGIDLSPNMLEVLKNKIPNEEHHRVSCQSVVDFNLDASFDLIIAPFRVMMHIINKNQQLQALQNIRQHLTDDGIFICDTFIPNLNYLLLGLQRKLDFNGFYEPGKFLKRYASSKPNLITQTLDITFELEWQEHAQVQKEIWSLQLRYYFRYELEHLLERSGFSDYIIYGDYSESPLNKGSKDFIVVCKK